MLNKNFAYLSILFALIAILAANLEITWLHYLSKPLIVGVLIGHLYHQGFPKHKMLTLVYAALGLSLLGDIFLMLKVEGMFIAGLGAFLLAQALYFFAFRIRSRNFDEKGALFFDLLLSIPLFTYFFLFLNEILAFIEFQGTQTEMYYPVMAYGIVIMLMGYAAITRYNRSSKASYFLILCGAVSFIISDSILAWNMFRQPVDNAQFYILISYAIAQLLLVKGTEEFMHDLSTTEK